MTANVEKLALRFSFSVGDVSFLAGKGVKMRVPPTKCGWLCRLGCYSIKQFRLYKNTRRFEIRRHLTRRNRTGRRFRRQELQ